MLFRNLHERTQEPNTDDKVRFLSDPHSYPNAPQEVDVIETHMSWVFLVGDLVYKLKKPVKHDFLDFSTLERRCRAVQDEARLNRRLAPGVYGDPLPITRGSDGHLALGGEATIVDWLVVMQRLPDERNFQTMAECEQLQPHHVARVANTLGEFYAALPVESIEAMNYIAKYEAEYDQTKSVLEDTRLALDGARLRDALQAFEVDLKEMRQSLGQRVEQGRVVEGHGDLRPQHIFLMDPPVIIDCLEFNRQLRLVDPFDEIAFLGMEAALLGADWVFAALATQLAEALQDWPPPGLLAFYWRYRALLRARLALLHLADEKPRTPEKWRPLAWRYIGLAEKAHVMTRLPEDP